MEHLTGMSEFEIHKTELYDVITKLPELHVTPAEYTRFRYASERPEKGKKVRQYEMDEDKRFVADVRVRCYSIFCGASAERRQVHFFFHTHLTLFLHQTL